MLPESVSPRVVLLLAFLVAFFVYLPLMPLETALLKPFGVTPDKGLPVLLIPICFLSNHVLVPRALGALGIRVRTWTAERFRAADRDELIDAPVELPIRIRQGQWIIRIGAALAFLLGSSLFLYGSCLPEDRLTWPARLWGAGLLLVGLILSRTRAPLICEISEEGIRAPEEAFRFTTFVPWTEITDCEFINDSMKYWCDHFVLYDRSGRERFVESGSWLPQLRAADRARVLRALRFRFPRKAGPGHAPELKAGLPASAVWDRELDG